MRKFIFPSSVVLIIFFSFYFVFIATPFDIIWGYKNIDGAQKTTDEFFKYYNHHEFSHIYDTVLDSYSRQEFSKREFISYLNKHYSKYGKLKGKTGNNKFQYKDFYYLKTLFLEKLFDNNISANTFEIKKHKFYKRVIMLNFHADYQNNVANSHILLNDDNGVFKVIVPSQKK